VAIHWLAGDIHFFSGCPMFGLEDVRDRGNQILGIFPEKTGWAHPPECAGYGQPLLTHVVSLTRNVFLSDSLAHHRLTFFPPRLVPLYFPPSLVNQGRRRPKSTYGAAAMAKYLRTMRGDQWRGSRGEILQTAVVELFHTLASWVSLS
jgi:hypothetical protein